VNFKDNIGLLIGVFTITTGAALTGRALSTPEGHIVVGVAALVLGMIVTVLAVESALNQPVEGGKQ